MRRGDFSAAWAISDEVLRSRRDHACVHLPRHQQFVWTGGSISGKRVLLRCYHGLGDTIQFIRYAALVRAQARDLTVWAQSSLVNLLRDVEGVDRVLPLHDGTPEVPHDLDIESMELPHLFRTTLATIPSRVPYLRIPRHHQGGTGHGCKVGVIWRAGGWDDARSVPVDLLAALADVPGVALCALQRGTGLAEWREEYGPISGADDVMVAARTMQTLDLIISVDSFPAHLAGALGRPVWTMLRSTPDWRWMDARPDSPWYPTMRLFRQARPGDWGGVIADVAAELRRFVANSPNATSRTFL